MDFQPDISTKTSGGRDKRAAFVRLAEKRTTSVLQRIRVLSNLSNKHLYEYSEEDVAAIFEAIDEELRLARMKFAAGQRGRPAFRFPRD
jgi:hypothetical protein